MEKSNTKIVFFGTAEFAIPALEALINAGYKISAIVTKPDELAGRNKALTPPPLKDFGQKLSIPVIQPAKLRGNSELFQELRKLDSDIGIVAAYGKLIPQEILDLPKHGFINIHPSLLPKYRGPSPVQAAILNGDPETGTSIMIVDEEMDHGPVLASERVAIGDKSFLELNTELWMLGAELLVKTLPEYLIGKSEVTIQDDSLATYSEKIKTEDGEVAPDDNVEKTYNKIRALNPDPGTYFWIENNGKRIRLKILDAEILAIDSDQTNGSLLAHDSMPVLKLKNGGLILKRVQPEGKKAMGGKDFLLGYRQLFK
ncbi:MAG: methionyl-tRNA formyltransferase [Candidatus Paceibacterota bacterium]